MKKYIINLEFLGVHLGLRQASKQGGRPLRKQEEMVLVCTMVPLPPNRPHEDSY